MVFVTSKLNVLRSSNFRKTLQLRFAMCFSAVSPATLTAYLESLALYFSFVCCLPSCLFSLLFAFILLFTSYYTHLFVLSFLPCLLVIICATQQHLTLFILHFKCSWAFGVLSARKTLLDNCKAALTSILFGAIQRNHFIGTVNSYDLDRMLNIFKPNPLLLYRC